MLYLYEFEVKYWDEDACCNSITKGIVAGHTYSEALDTVVTYYGDEFVIEIKLGMMENTENGLLITDTKQSKQ